MKSGGRYPSQEGCADNVTQHPASADTERVAEEALSRAKERAIELRPGDLSKAERLVWDRVCLQLYVAQRMKPLYSDALAEYCRVVVRMTETRKDLDIKEWFYVTKGRYGEQHKARPGVAQLNDDFRKFTQLVAHFGLSPATELRYTAGKQGDLFDTNEFDDVG